MFLGFVGQELLGRNLFSVRRSNGYVLSGSQGFLIFWNSGISDE